MPRRLPQLVFALPLAAALAWATPAWAPGSLGLAEVLEAVKMLWAGSGEAYPSLQ
jgi:hypothetical protein